MVWERIEVLRSLIFAVGNESAKTAKIKRLENLALYGRSIPASPFHWFISHSTIAQSMRCYLLGSCCSSEGLEAYRHDAILIDLS